MASHALSTSCIPAAAAGHARGARWAVSLLLLVPWTVDAGRILYQGAETALTPVATCLTELHILHGMQQVAAGRPLYPAMGELPLTYHFYHPLTYLPGGLLGRWLDLDTDGLLIAGRALPFAAALGIVGILAFYVRRQTRDWWWAALCGVMILFYHSSTLTDFFRNRPETPALMLTLCGWLVVQCRPKHWPYVAALLFVAAIGFKQTFLAAPVACALQLLWLRDGKNFLRLIATSATLGLAMMAACYSLGGAGYFQHTVWAMKACPMDPVAGCRCFYPILVFGHWGMLFPAAVVAVLWLLWARKESSLMVYLVVCLIGTSIAHGKQGADLNYHGELSMLMALSTVLAAGHMWQARSLMAWCPLALLLLGTWLPIFAFGPGWNELSHTRLLRGPYAYEGPPRSTAASLAARYAPYRGEALIVDDAIAVRMGDPVVYDWYALKVLFEAGYADFAPLERAVRAQRFAVIVLPAESTDRWCLSLRDAALASGYVLRAADSAYLELWRPGTQ